MEHSLARKLTEPVFKTVGQINPNDALSLSVDNLLRQMAPFEVYNALIVAAATLKRDIDSGKGLQCSGVKR